MRLSLSYPSSAVCRPIVPIVFIPKSNESHDTCNSRESTHMGKTPKAPSTDEKQNMKLKLLIQTMTPVFQAPIKRLELLSLLQRIQTPAMFISRW